MNKRKIILDYHVERGEKEIVLEVHGIVTFGTKGVYHGPPEKCYPDEPDDVQVEGILLNGMPWDGELSGKEEDELEQMLLDAANDDDDYDPPSDDGRDDDYEPNLSAWYGEDD